MKIGIVLTIGFLLVAFADSSTGERKRISLAPAKGEYSTADIEKEIIFGREMAAIILADRHPSSNAALNRYVNLVGKALALHANRQELEFRFAVIESETINAYATPGGYIFVTTAAIERMANEAELAGVLAHEIAHVTERHIVTSLNIRADDDSMTAVLGKALGSSADSFAAVFNLAVDHAVDILFSKGLHEEDEYDADLQAIVLSSLTGYNPNAYLDYLRRIQPAVEKEDGELNKTHPSFSQRIATLEANLKSMGLISDDQVLNRERFLIYTKQ